MKQEVTPLSHHYYIYWDIFTAPLIQKLFKSTMDPVTIESTITCPHCGKASTETMPTDSCQYFWKCPNCDEVLKAKSGDCCVFCSYGDIPCPSIQKNQDC